MSSIAVPLGGQAYSDILQCLMLIEGNSLLVVELPANMQIAANLLSKGGS